MDGTGTGACYDAAMKRALQWLNSTVTYAALVFLLVAGVAGSLMGKPLLLTAVRSQSMAPTLVRGDMVVLWPIQWTEPRVGDILVFRVEAGSLRSAGWVIHRAVDGDPENGFITQGDNNEAPDQAGGANPPILPENIAARAVTVGGKPLRIPLLGYLPLWAETLVDRPYALPGAALLILVLAFAAHSPGRRRSRRRRRGMADAMVYVMGGVSLTVLVGAACLVLSQQYAFTYAVSSEGRAAIMGSSIGQLMVGDRVERRLTTVENKQGGLPLVLAVHSSDPQVRVEPQRGTINPGQELDVTMHITAESEGQHAAHIWVGLFYPILPAGVIAALAQRSYWLALGVVSLIPALPVFLIPLVDPSLRFELVHGLARSLRPLRLGR
nr:signal peptidase I [Bacillota bacterium]